MVVLEDRGNKQRLGGGKLYFAGWQGDETCIQPLGWILDGLQLVWLMGEGTG